MKKNNTYKYSNSYSTSEYLRDSYFLFDKFFDLIHTAGIYIKRSMHKLFNYEFETYVFRIIENLPYGIIILFLGFFLSITLFRVTEKQNGVIVTTILTGSMSPAIIPGSLVISIPEQRYAIGDIISYKEKSTKSGGYTGRILTHRIINEKNSEGSDYLFEAKGDNNSNPDSADISISDILGKVIVIIPYMGYIDFLIRTVPGFIIFIAIPSVMVILEARRYWLNR